MPWEREYLCRPIEVNDTPTRIHDEIVEDFVPTCRHCKKTAGHHVGGDRFPRQANPASLMFPRPWPCLFDSTHWDPMTSHEWVLWRRDYWSNYAASAGSNQIREQLRKEGFAKKILSQYPWGTKK